MPHGYQIKDQTSAYFMTLQVVGWVDIFTRQCYRDIVIGNLKFCQEKKQLEIYAYVIMSNHIHLLVRSGKDDLSGTIRDFKSYTAKIIMEKIHDNTESRRAWMLSIFEEASKNHKRNSGFQFWTHDNHAEEVYSNKFIDQKINYIHMNPVKAGIVEKPEDYLYSSARNYADLENVMDVIIIPRRLETY